MSSCIETLEEGKQSMGIEDWTTSAPTGNRTHHHRQIENKMKRKLTDPEVSKIRQTLSQARLGQSTLADLGAAHDLCQSAELAGTAAELRSHIRAMAADKAEVHRAAGRDVFTGVVSGIVTHMLMEGLL
jgi:hypothetical protein